MDVSFFLQMGWKSALIAGAALGLAYVLRSRAASDRAMVLRIGVTMLLLLPLAALALPALQIEAFSAPDAAPAAAVAPAIAPELASSYAYVPGPDVAPADVVAGDAQPAAASTIWDDPTPLVLLAYLGGLLMVGGRLLIGLFMLRRWTRAAREVTDPQWQAALARVRGADDRVRLLVSDAVPSPLSWGWRNPVILVDPDTLDEPEEADAILAHEMAHVARRDWVALMLARMTSVVFWFNPVVWMLEREIVQQAEEAADSEAARHVEPARYAQTLLTWASISGRALPANSIAPKQTALGRRIHAILDRRERPRNSAWTKFAALACIGLAAPIAAVQLVQAAQPAPPEAPAAPAPVATVPAPPRAPAAPGAPGVPAAPVAPQAPLADLDIDVPNVSGEVHAALAEVLPHIPEIVAASMAAVNPEEIERQVQEALRDADVEVRHMSRADRERVRAEVRRAMRQARESMARARVDMARVRTDMARVRVEMQAQAPRIALAVREAHRAAAIAPRAIAISMRSGAAGMAHGAEGMERGAQRMEEQARRFRDRNWRDQEIARQRARGRTVTHEDLIEAAEGMDEGARGMREGAREMREAARRMGEGRTD
ncbi:MAG TPA: M56 family metallopeptidase [Allosphingosinicella sp.]|nr:M56 family metallopeptidase [Allosphingosinicella sp.]